MNSPAHRFDPLAVYHALLDRFGPQHWWPADSRLEMILGAILTQQTAWTNVVKALDDLKAHLPLDLEHLYNTEESRLAEWIRASGFYRVKAKRIKAWVNSVAATHDLDLDAYLGQPADALRQSLLSVNGIGKETADCILLYAAGVPRFVIDAYTRRMMVRHGWAASGESYEGLAGKFTAGLPEDPAVMNEYHALLVELGKQFCRIEPKCELCPLKSWLPGPPCGP